MTEIDVLQARIRELEEALADALAALDACLNSSDTAGAAEHADEVLTKHRVLLSEGPY